MKHLITLFFACSLAFMANAQTDEKGDITISSSIVCEMCKNTIEKDLAYASGVKTARVDVENNEIHVKYNPEKMSALDIRKRINELGYVADDMKPTAEQYDRLHMCCRAPGVIDGEDGSPEHFTPEKEGEK
jgi:copper chaperone CopZ